MQSRLEEQMTQLRLEMLDISEAVDQHTKAIATVYEALEAIAKAQHIQLPRPLCNMKIERTLINRKDEVLNGEVIDAKLYEIE